MSQKNQVGIVGAGIAGIACAIRLAKKGYSVDVFEQNDKAGGKIYDFKNAGYRFDIGPTFLVLPNLIEELISLCDKDPAILLPLKKLETMYQCFFDDGTVLYAYSDVQRFTEELEIKTGEKPANVAKFFALNKELFATMISPILSGAEPSILHHLKLPVWRALWNTYKFDALQFIKDSNLPFFTQPKTVQLFNQYARYNGTAPCQTPYTLNAISHLEYSKGVYLPEGGMRRIVDVLEKLATEQGVRFHYGKKVDLIPNGQHLIIGKKKHIFDQLIVNVDQFTFYKKLSKSKKLPGTLKKLGRSSSAIIFFWGINRTFEETKLHNIIFSNNPNKESACLFEQKTMPDDPTAHIYISSKHIPADAPEGCENWYVMVNAPTDNGQDWNSLVAKTRKNVITKINWSLQVDIEQYICFEHVRTPLNIDAQSGAFNGSRYSFGTNNSKATYWRKSYYKSNGLYFLGGSMPPSGGIPLCLASAKLVANKFKDLRPQ